MTFTAGRLLWSLHVFSGCSGFRPQSKDMYRTKLIGNYKLTTGVSESGCLNISPLTGWQAVKGVSLTLWSLGLCSAAKTENLIMVWNLFYSNGLKNSTSSEQGHKCCADSLTRMPKLNLSNICCLLVHSQNVRMEKSRTFKGLSSADDFYSL